MFWSQSESTTGLGDIMSVLYRLLLFTVIVYAGYALVLMLFQRNLLYPGRTLTPQAIPSGVASGAEKFWIITSFGKVEARLALSNSTAKQPAVIYFHGNGELVDNLTPELEILKKAGFAVMLVEYPGYGHSSGRPKEATLAETAVAAYDMLVQRSEIDSTRIVSFGFSLGSYPAVALAVARPVRALVLAAPVASLRPFASSRFLPSFLLYDKYDNSRLVKAYKGPVLVIHGISDAIMPFWHGKELASAAENARFVSLQADHNDLMDSKQFWDEVVRFLQNEKVAEKSR